MTGLVEDIDPGGDALVIIPYPLQSSQVKDQPNDDDQEPTEDDPQESPGDALAHSSGQVLQQEGNLSLELRLKVSMKHLTVASLRARAMFASNYQESQPSKTDGLCHWRFEPLFDPEAFRIVMKIFHLQTRDLPESVTLDMMAHIAAIVDDLQCHDAVCFFTKAWIKHLNHRLPSGEICKDVIRWILIASVFHETGLFESATRIAILHSTCFIPTFGLPIHPNIIDMIQKKRQGLLEELINRLHNQVDRLSHGRTCVAPGCSSMLLGALIQDMSANNLFLPRPSKPFPDTSLSSMLEAIRSFESPTLYLPQEECFYGDESEVWELGKQSHSPSWGKKHRTVLDNLEYASTPNNPKYLTVHQCSLQGLLRPEIKSLEDKIKGLELPDAGTSSN